MTHKHCAPIKEGGCGRLKLTACFSKSNKRKDGLSRLCGDCRKEKRPSKAREKWERVILRRNL